MGVTFLVGLFLGWLAIGWWLWPVSWTDADPWDLRAEHQERYVTLVAKGYAQARNADQAQEALAGWDNQALTDLLATMQDQAPDSETRRQLADLASELGLPRSEEIARRGAKVSPAVPTLKSKLVTVCGTAGIALVVVGLIIFAVSTHPWESIAEWAQRARAGGIGVIELITSVTSILPWKSIAKWARRAQRARFYGVDTVGEPELIPGHFVSTYAQGRDDYADYFSIEAPDGQFLGECGLSIGRILGRETPRRVTALEMVLFDSFDHRTETRMLMSRYAHEDAALRQELMTRGEPILAEPGARVLVETSNVQMSATVTVLEYADQKPAEGVFQRVVVDLDVRIKHLPAEKLEGGLRTQSGRIQKEEC